MAYLLDIDPAARAQIRELPSAGTAALAEAFEVLSLVPERCEPINADNPDGGVYQVTFGDWRRRERSTAGGAEVFARTSYSTPSASAMYPTRHRYG